MSSPSIRPDCTASLKRRTYSTCARYADLRSGFSASRAFSTARLWSMKSSRSANPASSRRPKFSSLMPLSRAFFSAAVSINSPVTGLRTAFSRVARARIPRVMFGERVGALKLSMTPPICSSQLFTIDSSSAIFIARLLRISSSWVSDALARLTFLLLSSAIFSHGISRNAFGASAPTNGASPKASCAACSMTSSGIRAKSGAFSALPPMMPVLRRRSRNSLGDPIPSRTLTLRTRRASSALINACSMGVLAILASPTGLPAMYAPTSAGSAGSADGISNSGRRARTSAAVRRPVFCVAAGASATTASGMGGILNNGCAEPA